MLRGCAARLQPDASGSLQLGCLQGVHTARCKQFPAPVGCSSTGLALLPPTGGKVHGGWASRTHTWCWDRADAWVWVILLVCRHGASYFSDNSVCWVCSRCGLCIGMWHRGPADRRRTEYVACWDRLCCYVWLLLVAAGSIDCSVQAVVTAGMV